MARKTYGVRGFMDWVARIPVGSSTMQVHFTGGALTSYGVTPAEYTTENAFFQTMIERSVYFRDGRIELLRSVETKAEPSSLPSGQKPEGTVASEAAQPAAGESAGAGTAGAGADDGGGEMTVVAVTCLQDAQAWLAEHCGIATRNTRTKAAAVAAGAQHGVVFEGL